MINFSTFAAADGTPVYRQILFFIKRGIVAGTVEDGDELPSRRALSALLGINPNTAQKIYRILEAEGLIRSHSGAKSVLTLNTQKVERIRAELLEQDAKTVVRAMRQMGISKAEAVVMIETYWDSDEIPGTERTGTEKTGDRT